MGYHQNKQHMQHWSPESRRKKRQRAYLRDIIAENISKLGRDLDI